VYAAKISVVEDKKINCACGCYRCWLNALLSSSRLTLSLVCF
jgi:hypothetical protein